MKQAGEFPFLIKICGITHAEDGQCAVDAGATALGFNFYPLSPRYVTPENARSISSAITGFYLRVGVFVNASGRELQETATVAQLDVLQLHGTVPDSLPSGFRIWLAAPADSLPTPSDKFEAYLLDSPSSGFGGSGVSFDWSLAVDFPACLILAGGLHAGNVADAILATRPDGVDACSKLESEAGRKDPALVQAFVRAAAEAHRRVLSGSVRSNAHQSNPGQPGPDQPRKLANEMIVTV